MFYLDVTIWNSLQNAVVDPAFSRRDGGANPWVWGKNLAENCMKMKEIGPIRGVRFPGAPWIRQ